MRQQASINPLAWAIWFASLAVIPLVTRNPLYLTLALLVAVAVYLSVPRQGTAARAWYLFLVVGSTLALVSVLFNVLTVHVGDRPFARLPEALPIAGGPLTINALVYGLLSALAIATLLTGAAAFNTSVRQGDMIRMMPGSLTNLGVAGSIAITAIPQTIATARDIYDAQRARGRQFRGFRDAHGLIVPLLGTGLERALTLSEALETRGFGASAGTPVRAQHIRAQWPASQPDDGGERQSSSERGIPAAGRTGRARSTLVLAILLLIAALLLIGSGLIAPGIAALAAAVVVAMRLGPQRRRTRYRPLHWNRASASVAVLSAASATMLLGAPALTGATLAYDPFPRLSAPAFDPLIGAAILLLLAPLLGRPA